MQLNFLKLWNGSRLLLFAWIYDTVEPQSHATRWSKVSLRLSLWSNHSIYRLGSLSEKSAAVLSPKTHKRIIHKVFFSISFSLYFFDTLTIRVQVGGKALSLIIEIICSYVFECLFLFLKGLELNSSYFIDSFFKVLSYYHFDFVNVFARNSRVRKFTN